MLFRHGWKLHLEVYRPLDPECMSMLLHVGQAWCIVVNYRQPLYIRIYSVIHSLGRSIVEQQHIIPALGPVRLSQLRPAEIQRFYRQKLQSGRLNGEPGGLSPRSVQYIHAVLRRALTYLHPPLGAQKMPRKLDGAGSKGVIEAFVF